MKMRGQRICLVNLREFIKTKESVLKPGMTSNIVQRAPSYPKGSLMLQTTAVLAAEASKGGAGCVQGRVHSPHRHQCRKFQAPGDFQTACPAAVSLFNSPPHLRFVS